MENELRELKKEELQEIEGGLPFAFYAGVFLLGLAWSLAGGKGDK